MSREPSVTFTYVNYRGEVSTRTVRPVRIWFGTHAYHPGAHWFLRAIDTKKHQPRDFALKDISEWRPA